MNENELRARVRNELKRDRAKFTEATFLASLQGYRGNLADGSMLLTFIVGPGEKDEALKVTDAGIMKLLLHVERISRKEILRAKKDEATADSDEAGRRRLRPA